MWISKNQFNEMQRAIQDMRGEIDKLKVENMISVSAENSPAYFSMMLRGERGTITVKDALKLLAGHIGVKFHYTPKTDSQISVRPFQISQLNGATRRAGRKGKG